MKRYEIADRSDRLARGLGWFSIGLGITEIVAPGRLARLIGVNEHPRLIRMLGVREAISGIAILTRNRPTLPLWSRVAGDGMDLALLGAALSNGRSRKNHLVAATIAVAGVTALDTFCSIRTSVNGRQRTSRSVITVNRPQQEVYAFWRDSNSLKQIIKTFLADVEIVSARPDEFMEWRSADGMVVKSASVSFSGAFGRDGTEVRVVLDGTLPQQLLHEIVRRSKRLIETGEIATTEGQSAGPRGTSVVSRMIQRLEGKEVA